MDQHTVPDLASFHTRHTLQPTVRPCKMPEIIDDKSEHCVPFILERIKQHRQQYADKGETPSPFFVGLNGVQGAGKTTLVGILPLPPCVCQCRISQSR